MASKSINQIEYDGVTYEFQDTDARESIDALAISTNTMYAKHTKDIDAERDRAMAAEQALENSKMTKIPDMGLSSNDFTNDYKAMLDDPLEMIGATSTGNGRKGVVPAPKKGDEIKYLRGDGVWGVPTDTTYDLVTQEDDGLMLASDKYKLDNLQIYDDNEVSDTIIFSGNTISEALGNGRSKETTFNADGSITTVITKEGAETITLHTEFRADGSIVRTRS